MLLHSAVPLHFVRLRPAAIPFISELLIISTNANLTQVINYCASVHAQLQSPTMNKTTYTTGEAAEVLGVSSGRVRQMIVDGLLKTERFGRAHVITAEALEAARNRNTKPGPPTLKSAKKVSAKKGGKK